MFFDDSSSHGIAMVKSNAQYAVSNILIVSLTPVVLQVLLLLLFIIARSITSTVTITIAITNTNTISITSTSTTIQLFQLSSFSTISRECLKNFHPFLSDGHGYLTNLAMAVVAIAMLVMAVL